MAFDYLRIAEITQLGNSAGTLYANPSSKKTYLRLIVLHNTNTTSETVRLYIVPDSSGSEGTAGDANKFYQGIIAPNDTVVLEFPAVGLMLVDVNDTIQGYSTTASKVSVQIYGGQE